MEGGREGKGGKGGKGEKGRERREGRERRGGTKGRKERKKKRKEGKNDQGKRKESRKEVLREKVTIVYLLCIHFGATFRDPGSQHKQQYKFVKPPPQEGTVGTDITPAHRSTAGAVPIGNPQGQGQPLAWTAPPAASPCTALIAVDNCTDVDHNFPALSPHLGKRVQSPNETPGDKQQAGERAQPAGKLLLGSAHSRQMDQREEMGARLETKVCLFGDAEKSSLKFISEVGSANCANPSNADPGLMQP